MSIKTKAKPLIFFSAISMLAATAAGCGGKPDPGAAAGGTDAASNTPVEITFYASTLLTDQDFETFLAEPARKKFPHIKINKLDKNAAGGANSLKNITASGVKLDIIFEGLTNIQALIDADLPADMTALSKKHNIDMNRFIPGAEEIIRAHSPNKELLAIPFSHELFATQYNKDIFDKFGVAYPKNNMTWDQVVEMSRQFNKVVDGVQYQGMNIQNLNRINRQLAVPWVDEKTNRAVITNAQYGETWKNYFQLIAPAYQHPTLKLQVLDGKNQFLKNNLAMLPDMFLLADQVEVVKKAMDDGLKWDLVTYPVLKDKPGVSSGGYMTSFMLSKNAPHPDVAMQLIQFWTSDDVQLAATKKGRITALRNPEIQKHAFEEIPFAKGLNIASLFTLQDPKMYTVTPYDAIAHTAYRKYFTEYVQGKSDLNTSMRKAEEETNKKIDAAMLK